MADNVNYSPAGATPIATDDVGGAHYQRVKLNWGVDGARVDTSDTDPLPVVSERGATATLANVAASATSVTLQASNTGRRGWMIHNDSSVECYVKLGSTASSTSYTKKLEAFEHWVLPFLYTGIITGIWASATGNARVTELTA